MSVRVMSEVWGLDLPHSELLVLLALADHAHDDGSKCYPGVEYIAWKSGYDRRSVQRILRDLESKGLIEAVAFRDGGARNATEYHIHTENGHPKPPYERGGKTTPLHERRGGKNDTEGRHFDHGRGGKNDTRGGAGAALTISNREDESSSGTITQHVREKQPVSDLFQVPESTINRNDPVYLANRATLELWAGRYVACSVDDAWCWEITERYRSVDLREELKRADRYIREHPERKRKGTRGFIENWLRRAVEDTNGRIHADRSVPEATSRAADERNAAYAAWDRAG